MIEIKKLPMMKILTILIVIILSIKLNAQDKPSYPQPKEGFKRVDLLLPKIKNPKDYQVQVKFSFEAAARECSDASFSFNRKNVKEEYGIQQGSRYPYYVIESGGAEFFEGMNSDCKSNKKIKRKIMSSQDIVIEYQSYHATPFYIPKSWSVEYRIWKADDKYTTVKN
ncbi:ecotin family protein [uncultured Chryseobacterium sp.]|uniref:ecotin family protein n=1 Tax=uncultured Chryseobacterium sp. TaxID=259322 RepID=UPI0025DBEC16|nr:ecotin family protein [uncultured Chryseobacterium sp.]